MTTRRDQGLPSHPSRPFQYGNPGTPESLAGVWRGPRPLTDADLTDIIIDTIQITEGSAPTKVNISFRVYERKGNGGTLFVWTNPLAFTSPDPTGEPDGSLTVPDADLAPLEGYVDKNTEFALPEGSPNTVTLLKDVMVGASRAKLAYAEYQTNDNRTSGVVAIPLGQPIESFDNTGRINPGVPLSDGEYVEVIRRSVERLHAAIGLSATGFSWEQDVKDLVAGVPGARMTALPVVDADAIETLIDTEFKIIKNISDEGGRPLDSFLGKPLAGDPDTLDSVPNGLTFRKLTGVDATGKATNSAFVDNLFATAAIVDRLFASNVFTQAVMTKVLGADSIIAEKIAASELAAITANLGVITAGRLRSIDQRFDLHLDYKIFTIVDPLGQTRVQIGNYNSNGDPTDAGGGDSWGMRVIGKDGLVMLDTDYGGTGVIYGRYINVDNLAAIKADLGTITAGKMLSADGLWGIILSGTVPGGLRGFVNFSDAAQPFLKHPRLTLPGDTSGITKSIYLSPSVFVPKDDQTTWARFGDFALSPRVTNSDSWYYANVLLPPNVTITGLHLSGGKGGIGDTATLQLFVGTSAISTLYAPVSGGTVSTTPSQNIGTSLVQLVLNLQGASYNGPLFGVGAWLSSVRIEYTAATYDQSI